MSWTPLLNYGKLHCVVLISAPRCFRLTFSYWGLFFGRHVFLQCMYYWFLLVRTVLHVARWLYAVAISSISFFFCLVVADEARAKKCGVLVHCLAGISRSVTVTVAYLMKSHRLSLNDAYDFVKKCKPNISPNFNFMGQLLDFERTLNYDCSCSDVEGSPHNCTCRQSKTYFSSPSTTNSSSSSSSSVTSSTSSSAEFFDYDVPPTPSWNRRHHHHNHHTRSNRKLPWQQQINIKRTDKGSGETEQPFWRHQNNFVEDWQANNISEHTTFKMAGFLNEYCCFDKLINTGPCWCLKLFSWTIYGIYIRTLRTELGHKIKEPTG